MDLNWQIISLKTRKKFVKFTAMILTAVLFLLGAAPSFAEEMKPSAKIDWSDAPSVEGTSALLMDAGSGEILYEKNAHEQRTPASVTKMLTCLVVLETMELDQQVTVPAGISGEGTNLAVKEGETFTVEQLLYGLMLYSANDMAEVLAIASGGSIQNFCDMMNERARRCGAEETNFTNPNGMNSPGQENHKTTAYDLAVIAREAMKNKDFRKIVSTVEYTIPATNLSEARAFRNGNRCISDGEGTLPMSEYVVATGNFRYEGAIGVKTGYTSTAGNCFCGFAQRDGTDLIAVTLNATSLETRFTDVMNLWDYGFGKYYTYTVAKSREAFNEIPVKRGEKGEVKATVKEDFDITLNKEYNSDSITTQVKVKEGALQAPIKKGDVVGTLVAYKEGDPVAKTELYAMEGVEEGGLWSRIGIPDEDVTLFLVGVASIVALLILIRRVYLGTRRRRRLRKRAKRGRTVRRREWEKERRPFDFED